MKLVKPRAEPAASATIEFNRAELEFLAAVVQKIGGSPTGARKHSDRLRSLLEDLGYEWEYVERTDAYRSCVSSAGIMFSD